LRRRSLIYRILSDSLRKIRWSLVLSAVWSTRAGTDSLESSVVNRGRRSVAHSIKSPLALVRDLAHAVKVRPGVYTTAGDGFSQFLIRVGLEKSQMGKVSLVHRR